MVRLLVCALLLAGGLQAATVPCIDPAELGDADAVVLALIDVHGGVDCDQVKLRSLHKIAAAQHAAQQQNQNAPLNIGLHVMDTCGSKRKAVRLAFKSLVFTDPSICKKPPLMLGYLGPDDEDILAAVEQVTGVYKFAHLNPFSLTDGSNSNHHNLKVKGISSVMRQLNWSTYSVLHSTEPEAVHLASALGATACVPQVRRLVANEAAPLAQLATRGVLVIGSTEHLLQVVRANGALDSPHALVLVALEAGVVPPLALLDSLAEPSILLQLAPNRPVANLNQHLTKSELWEEYLHQQRCNFSTCSVEDSDVADLAAGVQDAAVTGVSHAMLAFAKALKTAQRVKCPDRPAGRCPRLDAVGPEDWRRRVSAELDAMLVPLPPHFDIFYKHAYSQGLSKITNFTGIDFPSSKGDDCRHMVTAVATGTGVTKRITTPAPRAPQIPLFKDLDDDSDEDDMKVDFEDVAEEKIKVKPRYRDMWAELDSMTGIELGAVLFGFACCVGVSMGSCIYCIYNTFKVKGHNDNAKDRRSERSDRSARTFNS